MTSRGIAYLVIALSIFAAQDAIVKHLTQQHEVVQILTWRILVVVCIIGSIAAYKHGVGFIRTQQPGLMLLRGFLAFSAFTNYYFALSYIPLGDAATVYMTAPLFVTALSVPLLREQVGLRRWIAVIIGFLGVVVMLNPGSAVFRPIVALPLASALFYSLIPIITRKINTREHTLTITFYTAVSYALCCLLMTVAVHWWQASPDDTGLWSLVAQPWHNPNLESWMWIVLSSVMFSAGIVFITAAYREADVSILAPFEYSYLLSATVIGYLVFSDIPSTRTLLAACVIAGSGIYIALRERRLTQQG